MAIDTSKYVDDHATQTGEPVQDGYVQHFIIGTRDGFEAQEHVVYDGDGTAGALVVSTSTVGAGYGCKLLQTGAVINATAAEINLLVGATGIIPFIDPGTYIFDKAPLSIYGWTTDIVFSKLAYNKVQWSAGSIWLSEGTEYSISSGNTGVMAADTAYMIFLDVDTSATVL